MSIVKIEHAQGHMTLDEDQALQRLLALFLIGLQLPLPAFLLGLNLASLRLSILYKYCTPRMSFGNPFKRHRKRNCFELASFLSRVDLITLTKSKGPGRERSPTSAFEKQIRLLETFNSSNSHGH